MVSVHLIFTDNSTHVQLCLMRGINMTTYIN